VRAMGTILQRISFLKKAFIVDTFVLIERGEVFAKISSKCSKKS